MYTLEAVVFWVLLVDSLVANGIAWWGGVWYAKHLRSVSRVLPITKAWAGYYLALVLWIGYLTF